MQGWSKRNKSRMEIPELVVMDILSKLPVKSLLRFRCVCKTWCSSFQTSYFITKHHHNNLKNNNLNLLLKRCHGNTHDNIHYFSALSTGKGQNFLVTEKIHLPFFENCLFDPLVYGPCNGLLCLRDGGKAALWNPSTREFKIIPKSTVPRPPDTYETSFSCSGFGFDSRTDDYKVIRFVTNYVYDEDEFDYSIDQVELYSLKTDSWKEISVPESSPYESCLINSCQCPLFNNCINGFYYWPAIDKFSWPAIDKFPWPAIDKFPDHILSFDMANEKFSTLSLPKFGGLLGQYYMQLLDFNGYLGAIVYSKKGTEKSFNLWVMNGEWNRQFSIESIPGVERPLGFWKNNEMFLESSNHELVLLDPITRKLKNLGIYERNIDAYRLIAYVETLIPINGRSEQEEHTIHQPAGYASNRQDQS